MSKSKPISRSDLPPELFRRRPLQFVAKFGFAFGIVAIGWVIQATRPALYIAIPVGIVLGLIYAHLVELQHECLHHHAMSSKRANRFYGFLSGLPLMSSYSHYRYQHLAHHANLGKETNLEFFNYRFDHLDSWHGLGFAAIHPGRYADWASATAKSFLGKEILFDGRPHENRRIRAEYILMLAILVGAIAASIVFGFVPLLLSAWILPALLVGEPAHYLIEMPEHFGLNTQTNPDVFTNTRTIQAGFVGQWYTNFNNLHTAHHSHPGVPMVNARDLHAVIEPKAQVVEESYGAFFKAVVAGEIVRVGSDETCMTR